MSRGEGGERRRREEPLEGVDREGGNGGGEGRSGGRVVYPTPIEVIDTSGSRCNIFDAGGLGFSGIRVDGLVREREEISRARRRSSSTDPGSEEEIEDDSGAEPDLPSSGSI